MRYLIIVLGLVLFSAPASAGCAYGQKNLAGSLGPGQTDWSRSFTVNGSANFVVQVTRNGPITANLGCGWKTGRYHSCRVYGNGEINVGLQNNTGKQITYRWICKH
ncbi:MAG: hypothetical protein GC150_06545 [Rhizobiales bacterium]|nr:hypothetical protein [Hyphomicrobiales bacterium]